MTRWLKATTLALALLLCVALPAAAKHGRHQRHERRSGLTRHMNNANPTPGIPRRVRRGRNLTPGVPRGRFGRDVGVLPIHRHGRGHDEMLSTERNRDRDLGEAIGHGIGHGGGTGMGHGGGHGHGRRP
ncbi:MAG TPA: hypothetical protein VE775_12150 [Pyrinomonadaceae bacterium]|nr:hypothetical protein [Pyrinomonadaceae bacterium]